MKTAETAAKIGDDSGRRGPNIADHRLQRPFFFPRVGIFLADFFVAFFFADFRAGLAALFFAALFLAVPFFAGDAVLPPPKMDIQLSANFFVAPTRVLLIA